MKYDLSILIPARHEEFISNTVADIVKNKRGSTEVIVGLDGAWANPGIPSHPDVRIVYSPEALGQRGMTNKIAKLSRAKYVAKTDAHCAFDEGFDIKLMDAVAGHDDWTIVPAMKNLHAFNWICNSCGTEYYQGERPEKCTDETCQFFEEKPDPKQERWQKKIVFAPRGTDPLKKNGPTSTAYRFTPDRLQFKYFGALKAWQDKEGDVAETMSLQGSFFMLTREKYWELNICDESWGGWGQQGTEVALKTWLSGGRVLCHRGTWYAHMFRTNNQVAFPWNHGLKESQGKQQRRAREACIDLFKNNKWDKQVRGLSWLIERFWEPLQAEPSNTDNDDRKWTTEDIAQLKLTEGKFNGQPTKGILYFTDNELPLKIAKPVQRRLRDIAVKGGMELVSSSRKRMDNMGTNVVTNLPRGYECYFTQIVAGLRTMKADVVFMAEHDVLYPAEHFDFDLPDNRIWYDTNWWKVRMGDGFAVRWKADQVSGLCARRETLLKWYEERLRTFDATNFDRKFEPLSGEGSAQWECPVPHIDIRHRTNLTYNKWKLEHFRKKETAIDFTEGSIETIPGWDANYLSGIVKS